MKHLRKWSRPVVYLMTLMACVLSLATPSAHAALVGTGSVDPSGQVDRARVKDFLARDDVRQVLVAQGVDPAEAAARVDSLSNAEVLQIQNRIDALPAGAGFWGIVLIVVIVIAVIALIYKLI